MYLWIYRHPSLGGFALFRTNSWNSLYFIVIVMVQIAQYVISYESLLFLMYVVCIFSLFAGHCSAYIGLLIFCYKQLYLTGAVLVTSVMKNNLLFIRLL